jgi:hypothetical protein
MKKFIILAGIWTGLLIGGFIAILLTEDRTGPIITVNGTDIVYNQADDKGSLLSYVTAVDEKDGDVTETVMVADILPLLNKTSAKVVYVAEDKSNNVTKKEVYVNYAPLKEEILNVSNTLEEEAVLALNMSSADANDKNNESSSPSNEIDTAKTAGEDNSEEVVVETNPVLTLISNEQTIESRDEFEPRDLIESVSDDKDLVNYLMEHISIVGNYDVNTRGDYVLMYYATDSDGNESERLYMVLTVE